MEDTQPQSLNSPGIPVNLGWFVLYWEIISCKWGRMTKNIYSDGSLKAAIIQRTRIWDMSEFMIFRFPPPFSFEPWDQLALVLRLRLCSVLPLILVPPKTINPIWVSSDISQITFRFYLFYVRKCFPACVSVHHVYTVISETKEGIRSWKSRVRLLWSTMWVLGTLSGLSHLFSPCFLALTGGTLLNKATDLYLSFLVAKPGLKWLQKWDIRWDYFSP